MTRGSGGSKQTAVVWIRDGVLIDRMHINSVAFAFASWQHILPEHKKRRFLLEDLINFSFAKSGYSCRQKMQLFNLKNGKIIQDIAGVANDYEVIATKAAESAKFFEGMADLLRDLKAAGALNFITSAVDQGALDAWLRRDTKGQLISPHLTEILGAREGFVKGKDHFEYIVNRYQIERIYYVADAVSEIATGRQYSTIFNIVLIGFAHMVTVNDVARAIVIVKKTMRQLRVVGVQGLRVDQSRIILPNEDEISISLKSAGAAEVATEGENGMVRSLREYFNNVGLIS